MFPFLPKVLYCEQCNVRTLDIFTIGALLLRRATEVKRHIDKVHLPMETALALLKSLEAVARVSVDFSRDCVMQISLLLCRSSAGDYTRK